MKRGNKMKFSYNWLKRHLDNAAPPSEIAQGLTFLGLEVEECRNEYDYLKDFRVAVIEEAQKHPNADKLKVCKVFDGQKHYNIVCGAPNARAGIKVALAVPGVIIPDTGSKLKAGNIRGVQSEAMMCSRRELKLGTDHDGIIELDEVAVLGESLLDAMGLNNPVFDISLTPNRSDCFGVIGAAREAAAKQLGQLRPLPSVELKKPLQHDLNTVYADDAVKQSCTGVATILIKGVKNRQSPEWLSDLLKSAGVNLISAIVDVTNFVNLDLCRPLHAYDAKKINGSFEIRFASAGEQFRDLSNRAHILANNMVVSSDKDGPLCLMGIIGGDRSGCSMETTDILLEAALFDPVYIATVGQHLNITTDSRTRFERGVDPSITIYALERAAQMIIDICGGEASEVKVIGSLDKEEIKVPFSGKIFRDLSGFDLEDGLVRQSLIDLGFAVDENFLVSVPSYRSDITIKEDLVEEVLRVYGYDKIVTVNLPIKDHVNEDAVFTKKKIVRSIRRKLCFAGLDESINYSFISEKQARLFGELDDYVMLENPISSEMSYMRKSLIPGLITGYERIINKADKVSGLFEIGNITLSLTKQRLLASGIRSATVIEKSWHEAKVVTDPYTVKADLVSIIEMFGVSETKLDILNIDLPKYYHPGKSGVVKLGHDIVGYFGQIHPLIMSELDIKEKLFAFECNLDLLFLIKRKSKKFTEKKFHNLYRDFAFICKNDTNILSLLKSIRKANDSISEAVVFDIYQDEKIGSGNISVAIRVTIEQRDATMGDEEIQEISSSIMNAISAAGCEIRK